MAVDRVFRTANEALCYAAEVQLATLEEVRGRKRSAKSEIRRHESIAETFLAACRMFASAELARKVRCHRVERLLGPDPAIPAEISTLPELGWDGKPVR